MKKQYYSIGEICNLLGLKDHTIRFWEENFRQLKPAKIGSRNRKYSLKDVEILKDIQYLLHKQNYTIKGAKKVLNNKDRKKQIDMNAVETPIREQMLDIIGQIKDIIQE